jgi:hypothetical protein
VSDEDDDPFRFCIYCGVDCYEPLPEHGDECPSNTGLWPVTPRFLNGGGCENCECSRCQALRPKCCRCGVPFKLGDVYVLIDTETGRPATRPDIGECVCVGCGASAEIAA